MANTTGPSDSSGPVTVPALKIGTERQAVIALIVEVGFVLVLAMMADQGPGWAVAIMLVLIALWILFLMGNAGALKSKFGGIFG